MSASIPGIKEYIAEFTSDKAIGEEGYLADKGLIPLPEDRDRGGSRLVQQADATVM